MLLSLQLMKGKLWRFALELIIFLNTKACIFLKL